MADDSLTEGTTAFNRRDTAASSLSTTSSRSRADFQSQEQRSFLERSRFLLRQAEAMGAVALQDGLEQVTQEQRDHYLVALNELIVAALEQLDQLAADLYHEEK